MKPIIRVLVVDDSPTVREILVSMLQSEPGFQVVGQAQDGEEAVQLSEIPLAEDTAFIAGFFKYTGNQYLAGIHP